MPARSLLQMAQKICIRDVRYIDNVGDMPLKIDGVDGPLKPVLWAIEQPDQLRRIELKSPQIIGDDAEIWIKFIQRDVAKYADTPPPHPKNQDNWYRLYQHLVKQNQEEMDAQAAELKATLGGIRDAKLKNQLQSKDKSELPKLPKLGGMQFSDEGRILRKRAAATRAKLGGSSLGNAGSKTKDFFKKIQKEKAEAAKMRNMYRPHHELQGIASRITKARQSQVEEHHKPAAPKSLPMMRTVSAVSRSNDPLPTRKPISDVARPAQRRTAPDGPKAASGSTLEAREKRLLAYTNPNSSVKATSTPSQTTNDTARISRNHQPPTHLDTGSIQRSTPAEKVLLSMETSAVSTPAASGSRLTPTLNVPRNSTLSNSISPEPKSGPSSLKKKAPADVFMPAKRRKIA